MLNCAVFFEDISAIASIAVSVCQLGHVAARMHSWQFQLHRKSEMSNARKQREHFSQLMLAPKPLQLGLVEWMLTSLEECSTI